MNDYLVFDTEQEANAALDVIYSSMVAAITSPDLLDVTTDQVIPQAELDDQERVEFSQANRRFPVFGTNAATGVRDTSEGYTTAWAVAQETVQGKWVFPKPDDALMGGVSGYTVKPYDPDWFPQATP